MSGENTNWCQSVTGVVIRNGKVLLARHTYGNGKNMLIIPGGYVNFGETPQEALKREFLEETKVEVKAAEVIGVRFNMHDWYIAFRADCALKNTREIRITRRILYIVCNLPSTIFRYSLRKRLKL